MQRVGGADRYATSRALITHALDSLGYSLSLRPVFVATGADFPDALGAAAAAGAARIPLLLVGSINESEFPAETVQLLDRLQPTRLFVAGGWGVVSPLAVNTYSSRRGPTVLTVVRFGGADRYETNRMINGYFFGEVDEVVVASGVQFPDALAAAPLSAALGLPLVLTSPNCVVAETARSLARQGTDGAVLVGGPGALSARVAQMSSC